MPSSVGAYLRSLSARTMERRQTASWWSKEYPLVDGSSENDDESCDARQPAGGTNILQSFKGLGFNENSKCAKHPPENLLLPGSWCFQLNGPPPPFEAFLFHGLRERLLRIGWGACVPYKKGSSVPDREYSKLFDADGYYKLNGKRPEKVPEVEIGQKRSDPDPYATVQIESENSTLYDCPPEKKKPDCKKRESSVLGEASQQLLPVDGSTMGEVKRGINWALVSFSCMGEKELQVFRYRLTKSMAMKDFHPVATVELNSSASPSDVENILRVMHTLLTKDGNVKGLLIVILPEDAASHGKVKEVCENLGVIYVCCLPQNVRNPTDNYMQHIAYKILEAVPYNTHSDKDSSNDESGEDDTLVGSEVDNCEEGPVPRSSNFHAEETGEYEAKHGFSDQHDIDDTQVGLDEMEEVDISEEGTEAIEGSEHGSDQLSDLDIDDTQVGSDEMEEVDSSEEETGAIEGSKHVSDQLSDLQDIDDGRDEDLWVVASLDWPGANVYRTLLSSQPRNEVIITDLNSQLSELVHEFHQSTKKMPIRIIYFRNGVTEDQLRHTFEHEIDAIRMNWEDKEHQRRLYSSLARNQNNRSKKVQECIGAAVLPMGPDKVLSLVPIAFLEDRLTCSNSWLLPILDKYTYGAPLQLFLEHIVPLAKSVQNASDMEYQVSWWIY